MNFQILSLKNTWRKVYWNYAKPDKTIKNPTLWTALHSLCSHQSLCSVFRKSHFSSYSQKYFLFSHHSCKRRFSVRKMFGMLSHQFLRLTTGMTVQIVHISNQNIAFLWMTFQFLKYQFLDIYISDIISQIE